jgi:hypothetical protein
VVASGAKLHEWRGKPPKAREADPVGDGEEYRAQRGEEVYASALTLNDLPVHMSVVVAG